MTLVWISYKYGFSALSLYREIAIISILKKGIEYSSVFPIDCYDSSIR